MDPTNDHFFLLLIQQREDQNTMRAEYSGVIANRGLKSKLSKSIISKGSNCSCFTFASYEIGSYPMKILLCMDGTSHFPDYQVLTFPDIICQFKKSYSQAAEFFERGHIGWASVTIGIVLAPFVARLALFVASKTSKVRSFINQINQMSRLVATSND